MTPPCGVPCLLALPPSMRRLPSPSVVSTGALSHCLITQHIAIDNAAGNRLHQLIVRDGVEVLAQIGVDHVGVALPQQDHHRLDRIGCTAFRPGHTRGAGCPLARPCRRADRTGSSALSSPCHRVSSAKSGSHLAFAGSSPITSPRQLRGRTRSQGPSLRQSYPASSVLRPCPTPARTSALRRC